MLNPKKPIDQWGPIDGKLFYASFWYSPVAKFSGRAWGVPWPTVIGSLDHDKITYYFEKDQMQSQGEKAIEKYINRRKRRTVLWREYQRQLKVLRRVLSPFEPPVPPADSKNLQKEIEKYYRLLMRVWSLVLVPEVANFAAPEYLRKKIVPHVPAQYLAHALQVLLAPEKMSFHVQSDYELYHAVSRAKTPRRLQSRLSSHAKKWHWVDNSYLEVKNISAQDFYNRVKKMTKAQAQTKMNQIVLHYDTVKKEKRKLQLQYQIPKKIMDLAQDLAFSIWWQDHRKGVIWWANSALEKIIRLAQKQYHLSFDDLMYYTAEEVVELFLKNKKIASSIIQKRKKFSVHILRKNKGYKIIYGKAAQKLIRRLGQDTKVRADGTLYGIPVSQGHAHGYVRILNSPKEIHRMKKGEILVAPMTSPDFIHAMKLSKAIVTDVGGLMSHAAVVSRELGIPCVVGTKFATRVLKDGDRVEVDANKGVVRKL